MEPWMQMLFGESGLERTLNRLVWGTPAMLLILGTGIFLSIRCGFPQFVHFGHIMRNTAGKALQRQEKKEGVVSPFQAMCTALAASIGTGNIAGVSGAIALGGPGAVFWMWVSALLGMCTKFAEVTLSVHYRTRNQKGDYVGGPMYYIERGLGKKAKPLAAAFALFGMLAAFGIGNLTQINTIAATVNTAIGNFLPTTATQQRTISVVIGILGAAAACVVLVGGIRRIGDVCERLVPAMALFYVAAALVVIGAGAARVPAALRAIFVGAFQPAAVIGGAAGIGIRSAIKQGISRGIFSNEAGLGSAPIAHAAADVDHPVKQGIYGVFEVFMDTIVVCTMTALVILLGIGPEKIPYGQEVGADLTVQGFSGAFGNGISGVLVALCLTLFAFSTILTWALYGTRCAAYLLGDRAEKPYQILFCAACVFGAVARLEVVWHIADTLNGLMALPNLIALLLLSPVVCRYSRQYFAQLGKKPAAPRR